MKKRFVQLKTTFIDLINIVRRFKMRLLKFFGLDKILNFKLVKYIIRLLKIAIKIVVLFKISMLLIKMLDNSIYLSLLGIFSALYSLLKDDLYYKVKTLLTNKIQEFATIMNINYIIMKTRLE